MHFLFFFKQKTAYEIGVRLVGSEMCIRDRSGDVLGRLLVSVCHFCCPELSVDVWNRCLGAFKVKCMYVCWVWMHQMVYLSVQALNGAANALYWNISERLNCIHLTLLKHQNTKTALSKLSKNHWGFAFFKKFGSGRKKLQFTVFLDHPVQILTSTWEEDTGYSVTVRSYIYI